MQQQKIQLQILTYLTAVYWFISPTFGLKRMYTKLSQKKYEGKAAIKNIVQVSDTTEVPQRISVDLQKRKTTIWYVAASTVPDLLT